MELLLQKLSDLFQMDLIMLGGGGVLNWSFIQAGLCDEVSVVIAPAEQMLQLILQLYLIRKEA